MKCFKDKYCLSLLFLSWRSIFLLLLLYLNILAVKGQVKNIGIPFMDSYTRADYNAGTQNWCITQDDNDFLYFANNKGVLRFNGKNWHLFPLPNNSVVRAVAFINNRIYAGGFDEFGYFSYDENGGFNYTSLSENLSATEKDFDEVWRIHNTGYGIAFQSFRKLFLLESNDIRSMNPVSTFGFSYLVDNKLFVIDRERGLYILQQDGLKLLYANESFFMENEITFIFPSNENSYLIGTTNKGIYIFNGNSLFPWNKPINRRFLESQIYSALELPENQMAIGSIQEGLFIINKDGELIQHLNRFKGLQNNTVLSIYFDKYKNIWLGLDNGIDAIETSSPLSIINYSYNIETSYTSVVYKDNLYIGTNQGLFVMPFTGNYKKDDRSVGFKLVKATKGQVWNLEIVSDQLICGHSLGTFIISGDEADKISSISGGWTYCQVPNRTDLLIGGTYTGLVLFKRSDSEAGKWMEYGRISNFDESCREIVFDKEGMLWVSHGYKGIYKLTLNEDYTRVDRVSLYNNINGLPDIPYTFSKIKDKFLVATQNGLYNYSSYVNQFNLEGELNLLFRGENNFTRVFEDAYGDIWYFTSNSLGVLRLQEDGRYVKISIPFNRIRNWYLSDAFENVYTFDDNNVFIGGQKGIFHYNPNRLKDFEVPFHTFLSDIKIRQKENDSTLYDLYGLKSNDNIEQKYPYKYNSISFSYFSAFFEGSSQTKYSYRLSGFDKHWSAWSDLTFKEYTNLSEGDYVFEVKAKNVYDFESAVVSFPFTIAPPLYRSVAAYILYSVIIILIGVINFIYFRRKVEKARRIEKIKHERVLIAKENKFKAEVKQSDEEIEKLRADKLKINMRHKNMELANATMHLIQKNKFLIKLKEDLLKMRNEAKVDSVKSDIKQIVKKIDKDFKNEKHWKVFDQYFDEVHQDFLDRLKEKHPVLTPNDLRLCAYLKMNLSTKEVAPLMNISIRGLEISRYRLRKKLELEREINLTDYILSL